MNPMIAGTLGALPETDALTCAESTSRLVDTFHASTVVLARACCGDDTFTVNRFADVVVCPMTPYAKISFRTGATVTYIRAVKTGSYLPSPAAGSVGWTCWSSGYTFFRIGTPSTTGDGTTRDAIVLVVTILG